MNKRIFIFLLSILFLFPLITLACSKDKFEVRVKLGVNHGLKECRTYLYESRGGFFKQIPSEKWEVVEFDDPSDDFFKKYCQALGYSYSDEILLPSRWERINWKFYYAIASIIVACAILVFPFVKFKKKKKK